MKRIIVSDETFERLAEVASRKGIDINEAIDQAADGYSKVWEFEESPLSLKSVEAALREAGSFDGDLLMSAQDVLDFDEDEYFDDEEAVSILLNSMRLYLAVVDLIFAELGAPEREGYVAILAELLDRTLDVVVECAGWLGQH